MLHDSATVEFLGVTLAVPTEGCDEAWVHEERKILRKFLTFLVTLCAFRAWSQMQFVMMMPQLLACVHHRTHIARDAGLGRARDLVKAVLAAEHAAYTVPLKNKKLLSALQGLLKDLSWNALQLAREGMAICQQCDYNRTDPELRLFSWLVFGRLANTKYLLEDVFNHVADISRRHAKNHTMQRHLVSNFNCGWAPKHHHSSGFVRMW